MFSKNQVQAHFHTYKIYRAFFSSQVSLVSVASFPEIFLAVLYFLGFFLDPLQRNPLQFVMRI